MQKPAKGFRIFKRASLKDSLQRADEKVKPQKLPKAKDCKIDVTPTAPLYPPLLEYLQFIKTPLELPFHSAETTKP